ncbi:MAG: hypothetical protein K2H29_12670 [Oscillospiraceae bacterium]|nr:hypothetical protein [Oscillospiraceae bacterium]
MSDKKSMVKNENFIVIHGWMVNELNLKGNELLVYAIIYGFSQTENQFFTGSLKHLAGWTSSTKQGVMKNLKSLIEKNLIQKEEYYVNHVKFVKYYATKFNTPMQQSLIGYTTEFNRGMQLSLPNNIIDNIIEKIEDISATPETNNSIEKTAENPEQKEKIPYAEILKLYNEICKSLPKARRLTENRRNAIRTRLHDGYSVDDIRQAFELAETSPFLRGEVNKAFHADFDWILSGDHLLKILENKYEDRSTQNQYTNPTVSVEGHNEEFLRLNGLIP